MRGYLENVSRNVYANLAFAVCPKESPLVITVTDELVQIFKIVGNKLSQLFRYAKRFKKYKLNFKLTKNIISADNITTTYA